MKALVLKEPGIIHIDEIPLREPDNREVMVKVKASSVCSTDFQRIFNGKSYFYPIVLGHEFSGTICKIGKNVKDATVGDKVVIAPLIPCNNCSSCRRGQYSLCDDYNYIGSRTNGGYAEYAIVPEENVLIIPEKLAYEAAVFCEPLAVAIHGLLKVLKAGDRVLIMGAGAIGLLCAGVAQLWWGLMAMVADVDKKRLVIGKKMGLNTVWLEPGNEMILDNLKSNNFDVVIEASGNAIGLKNSMNILKKNGKLLNLSLYNNTVEFDKEMLDKITREELVIKGSWNSYSQPFPGREWSIAINMLEKQLIDPRPLVSHMIKLYDADKLLKKIYYEDRENLMKIIITTD